MRAARAEFPGSPPADPPAAASLHRQSPSRRLAARAGAEGEPRRSPSSSLRIRMTESTATGMYRFNVRHGSKSPRGEGAIRVNVAGTFLFIGKTLDLAASSTLTRLIEVVRGLSSSQE
jgi:hypothetical protein